MKRLARLRWLMAAALLGGSVGLPLAHHVHHANEAEHVREHRLLGELVEHYGPEHDHDHGEPPGAPHGEDSPLHGALHLVAEPPAAILVLRPAPLAIRIVELESQPRSAASRLLPYPRGPPPAS